MTDTKEYILVDYICEVQEKAKLIYGDRTVVTWEGGGRTDLERAEENFLGWKCPMSCLER